MKLHPPHALGVSLVGAALCPTLGWVGSKVREANFERIHAGMTPAVVRTILGEEAESASLAVGPLVGTTATWKGPEGRIAIPFVNEMVFAK